MPSIVKKQPLSKRFQKARVWLKMYISSTLTFPFHSCFLHRNLVGLQVLLVDQRACRALTSVRSCQVAFQIPFISRFTAPGVACILSRCNHPYRCSWLPPQDSDGFYGKKCRNFDFWAGWPLDAATLHRAYTALHVILGDERIECVFKRDRAALSMAIRMLSCKMEFKEGNRSSLKVMELLVGGGFSHCSQILFIHPAHGWS